MADSSKPRRIMRRLAPEERARHAKIREQTETERPRIEVEAREAADRYEASLLRHLRKRGVFDLSGAIAALKSAREEQGLSLADVSARAGIAKPNLSDLETGKNPNPTLRTLECYAQAVGRKFVLGLIETSTPAAVR